MDNPYRVEVSRYRHKMRRVGSLHKPVELVDKETGEVTDATMTAEASEEKLLDAEPYVKVYKPDLLLGLSSSGLGVLLFVMHKLSYDGSVTIDVKRCMSWTGYKTRKSVYDGLADLARRDIIRQCSECKYWVNPNVLYKGQRNEFTIIRK